ncbi:MAG TPA: hypothetical protein VM866_01175 [Pyrinomonadaceae bacterium]|nr:hypothetical protein [Pyrinomonadaceae bacterium]
MNCQLFETVVVDLARSSITDAAARESGLNHAEQCAGCATRLAGERELTAGLRSVAASVETNAPAPRLEAVLLAAFRARNEVTAPRANLYALTSRRQVYAMAAAIVVAVFAGLIGINVLRSSRSHPVEQAGNGGVAEKTTTSLAPESAERVPTIHEVATINSGDEEEGRLPPRMLKPAGRASSRKRGAPQSSAAVQMLPVSTGVSASTNEEDINDVATEFLPLIGEDSFNSADGAQVVRVEMPRSALASFGLPMNTDLAGGRVKADVVLGHDGIARAIRFVR